MLNKLRSNWAQFNTLTLSRPAVRQKAAVHSLSSLPCPLCNVQMCATALTCPSSRSSVFLRSSCRCTGCGPTPSTATTKMTGCTLPSSHRTPGSTWPPSRSKRLSNTSVSPAYSSVHTQHWLSLRAALGDTCRNLFFLFSNFKCRQRKWSGEIDKKGHWILNWWDFISGTGVEIHGFKSEGFIYGGTFNPSDGSQKDNLLESAWIYVWFSWQVETHLTLLVPAGILFSFGWGRHQTEHLL